MSTALLLCITWGAFAQEYVPYIPFYCLKAVSDNLDGNLKDWRSILADIRVRFTELLNSGKE